MKASELRIGNWLNCKKIQKEDKSCVVVSIMNDFAIWIRYKFADQVGENEAASSLNFELTPIPLTEEWLLKFGFEYYADEDGGHWTNYRFTLKNQTWRVENQLNLLIKHVHQLQNIYFALTGEELTIQNGIS